MRSKLCHTSYEEDLPPDYAYPPLANPTRIETRTETTAGCCPGTTGTRARNQLEQGALFIRGGLVDAQYS